MRPDALRVQSVLAQRNPQDVAAAELNHVPATDKARHEREHGDGVPEPHGAQRKHGMIVVPALAPSPAHFVRRRDDRATDGVQAPPNRGRLPTVPYDPAPMSRPIRVLLVSAAALAIAALAGACGTEKISVPSSDPTHQGAVLFSQRCSGCHTLSYAAANGSASNVRTALMNNGPNFNVRCERPVTRVLYAIENGGFSGAIMPQNIVVGQDARVVAQFVSTYAGRQAPLIVGQTPCEQQPTGTLPAPGQNATQAAKRQPPGVQSGLGTNLKPGSKPTSSERAGGGRNLRSRSPGNAQSTTQSTK